MFLFLGREEGRDRREGGRTYLDRLHLRRGISDELVNGDDATHAVLGRVLDVVHEVVAALGDQLHILRLVHRVQGLAACHCRATGEGREGGREMNH